VIVANFDELLGWQAAVVDQFLAVAESHVVLVPAHVTHGPFQIVDCTRCANCCKTMNIKFDDDDIERIAGHLNISVDEFIEAYLEADEDDGHYITRQQPCLFLGEDDRCMIYDIRPTVCREYPHTNKEGLVFRTMGVANNALACPAVFWIVEQMKRQALR
jgi:Fe-S-cluster containining protein